MAEIKNIYEALSTVQEKLKAPKSNENTFGHYKYRSAEDIIEAVKPLLFANGLVMTISDQIVYLGERYYVEATISVQNGTDTIQVTALAREDKEKKGMSESQITGTASSYARKYALNGMFAIDDTKDADSNEYYKQTTAKPKQSKEPVKPFGPTVEPADEPVFEATPDQKKQIMTMLSKEGIFAEEVPKVLAEKYKHPIGAPMSFDKAADIILDLKKDVR